MSTLEPITVVSKKCLDLYIKNHDLKTTAQTIGLTLPKCRDYVLISRHLVSDAFKVLIHGRNRTGLSVDAAKALVRFPGPIQLKIIESGLRFTKENIEAHAKINGYTALDRGIDDPYYQGVYIQPTPLPLLDLAVPNITSTSSIVSFLSSPQSTGPTAQNEELFNARIRELVLQIRFGIDQVSRETGCPEFIVTRVLREELKGLLGLTN